MRHLPAYGQIAGMAVQTFLAYRVNVVMNFVSVLTQVYLLRVVWTAVYASRESVQGVPLPEVIAYLTLATLQTTLLFPTIAFFLEERVHEGSVGLDLARPAPLLGQLLARQMGDTGAILPFLAAALPFALIAGGLQAPASPTAGALYLVSMALAYAIATLISLLVGLMAFWTVHTYAFTMIFRYVSQLLGGALIPLWFFPDWLRAIAALLPFQTQAHMPLALYFGRIAPADVLPTLLVQALWVIGLYALAQLGWRRAIRRVVVQGG